MADESEDAPIFDFNETTRIASAWFIAWHETDWLAMVYQQDGVWRGRYRFRYYTDIANRHDAFNTNDRKSIYSVTPNDQDKEPQQLVDAFALIAAQLAATTRAAISERLDIDGSVDDYVRVVATKPWSHVKVTPPIPTVSM